jgi:hypothetical protein
MSTLERNIGKYDLMARRAFELGRFDRRVAFECSCAVQAAIEAAKRDVIFPDLNWLKLPSPFDYEYVTDALRMKNDGGLPPMMWIAQKESPYQRIAKAAAEAGETKQSGMQVDRDKIKAKAQVNPTPMLVEEECYKELRSRAFKLAATYQRTYETLKMERPPDSKYQELGDYCAVDMDILAMDWAERRGGDKDTIKRLTRQAAGIIQLTVAYKCNNNLVCRAMPRTMGKAFNGCFKRIPSTGQSQGGGSNSAHN